MARNLGVVRELCCTANITAVAQSCRIALYNICRIWPFLTREAAQIFVQALAIPRPTRSWLDSLPLRSNCWGMSRTPQHALCFMTYTDSLPVIPCIRRHLFLTYQAVNGNAPTYPKALVSPHGPAPVLCLTASAGQGQANRIE